MHDEIIKMFDFSGKVSFIVGGARDMGYDFASVLGAAGSDLAISSRNLEQAEESAEKLKAEYGVDALPVQLDHTRPEQVEQAAKKVRDWKGHIDVLINNAGGGAGGACRLFKRSPEDEDNLIKLNLSGPLYCCREVGKIMAKQGHGKIINISSIAGIVGRDRKMYDRSDMEGQPVDYAAAKAGVIGMTKDLAAYLSPMGINVNVISPGGMTGGDERGLKLPKTFIKDYGERTPLGRFGHDDSDIKGAALFLASAASDYITGHNLVVDGGFTIWQ